MENCSQNGNKLSWHYPSRKKPVEHVKVIFHQIKSPLKKNSVCYNVFLRQKHKNNTEHTANPLTCSVTKQSHQNYTCSQVIQDIRKTMYNMSTSFSLRRPASNTRYLSQAKSSPLHPFLPWGSVPGSCSPRKAVWCSGKHHGPGLLN